MLWVLLALGAAASAALVAIFGKIGVATVDPLLATTVRGIVMAVVLVLTTLATGRFGGLAGIGSRAWWFIALAGLAGAASWLFYFLALKVGPATGVAALDRLSIVFIIIIASLFLAEALTWKLAIGGALMAAGAILIAL